MPKQRDILERIQEAELNVKVLKQQKRAEDELMKAKALRIERRDSRRISRKR